MHRDDAAKPQGRGVTVSSASKDFNQISHLRRAWKSGTEPAFRKAQRYYESHV
jgi:hypothetical protein